MNEALDHRANAALCRRLLRGVADGQARAHLTALAEEYEAKAKAAERAIDDRLDEDRDG